MRNSGERGNSRGEVEEWKEEFYCFLISICLQHNMICLLLTSLICWYGKKIWNFSLPSWLDLVFVTLQISMFGLLHNRKDTTFYPVFCGHSESLAACLAHASTSWLPSQQGWGTTFPFSHLLSAVSCSTGLTLHCWFLTWLLWFFHFSAGGIARAASRNGTWHTSCNLVVTSVNSATDKLSILL